MRRADRPCPTSASGAARGRDRCGSLLGPWLGAAVALHAALLVGSAWLERELPAPAAAVPSPLEPFLLYLEEAPGAAAPSASAALPAPPEPSVRPGSAAHDSGAGAAARRTSRARGAEPPSVAALGVNDGAALASKVPGAEPEVGGTEGGVADADAAAGSGGPRLSLDQLGVGEGHNPFIGGAGDAPTRRQVLNTRLRDSLRTELARRDQKRGLGPEGPAVAAVVDIVMASTTQPNTTALLQVVADGAGNVTFVDVLESDRDRAGWGRIADELRRALAGKKLRVPPNSGGVSFQLRVVSREQLPSGADPGLAIDLFGVPVKKGAGEKSSKLSVLSPVIVQVPAGADGATVPVPVLSLLGAAMDPVDIGAVARRLVTAYLVAMDTRPPASPPPEAPRPTSP